MRILARRCPEALVRGHHSVGWKFCGHWAEQSAAPKGLAAAGPKRLRALLRFGEQIAATMNGDEPLHLWGSAGVGAALARLEHLAGLEQVRSRTLWSVLVPREAEGERFARSEAARVLDGHAERLGVGVERLLDLGGERMFSLERLAWALSGQRVAASSLHRRKLAQEYGWERSALSVIPMGEASAPGFEFGPGELSEAEAGALWGWRGERRRALLRAFSLEGEPLCVGFAGRLIGWERAMLLLRDEAFLKELLGEERPVVLFWALGAEDHRGVPSSRAKNARAIVEALAARFDGRLVVMDLEDPRRELLEAGVDLWLRPPRTPMGGSWPMGQRALHHGALMLGSLDGWWAEAFDGTHGWSFGQGDTLADIKLQDHIDGIDLRRALREEVVPCFFDRNHKGMPWGWLSRMKRSMVRLPERFGARAMAQAYIDGPYRVLQG